LDPGPHRVRDDLESVCDLLHGQELIGVCFVLRRPAVVDANGLEPLLSKVAKLVADHLAQELTQRYLDA
jgi:hypothetical protein